jgi:hypothetical protein
MKFLKTHVLSLINSAQGCAVSAQEVRWVVTVPAIWSDFAKQCMRLAAEQGGLCTSGNPDQMLIALEPEAASYACRRDLLQMGRPMAGGSKYLVFDCGGILIISFIL